MSEANEIADNMRAAYCKSGAKTIEETRTWLATFWPDWRDWISHQMFDNLIDALMDA